MRRWVMAAAAGWTLFIPLMSLLPPAFFAAAGDMGRIPGFDKLVHAFIYGVHAALLGGAAAVSGFLPSRRACFAAAAAAALYGLLMEALQRTLTECRQFSWGDALANVAGAVLAAAGLYLFLKWRERPAA